MTTFRQVLATAIEEAELPVPDDQGLADLATALQSHLHAAGMAIHASDGRCVRPSGDPRELGRLMTLEELAELAGLCAQAAETNPGLVCVLSRRHAGAHAFGTVS